MPVMFRRGAGPLGFFPAYVDRAGGTLFHFSGAAVWARRSGKNTPTAIAATPDDLCQQLGLQQTLGALRVRGLTALLMRMKRNARDLAL